MDSRRDSLIMACADSMQRLDIQIPISRHVPAYVRVSRIATGPRPRTSRSHLQAARALIRRVVQLQIHTT